MCLALRSPGAILTCHFRVMLLQTVSSTGLAVVLRWIDYAALQPQYSSLHNADSPYRHKADAKHHPVKLDGASFDLGLPGS